MLSLTIPRRNLYLRWNAIFCAIAIFVWSTPEEDRLIFSAALGVWLAVSLLLGSVIGRFGGCVLRGWRVPAALSLFGFGVGALANVSAVLLMVFKDARHAHLFPDYPPALLGAMLARLPVWAVAGLLFGLGAALLLVAFSPRKCEMVSHEGPPML